MPRNKTYHDQNGRKKHHHCDLAPSAAKRAQGESFKTISSTLTLFLLKSRIRFLLTRKLCLPVLACLQECVQWSSPHEVRHPRPETSQAQNWLRQLPDDGYDDDGDDDVNDDGCWMLIIMMTMMINHDDQFHQLTKKAKSRGIEVSGRHQGVQDPPSHCHLVELSPDFDQVFS